MKEKRDFWKKLIEIPDEFGRARVPGGPWTNGVRMVRPSLPEMSAKPIVAITDVKPARNIDTKA
ncbi:hypothetical protein [Azotobacter beijerinckii]|uniref:hypothetical protein n=1 Tax=Azotobacter beijerinckii TaxID=170623 RepID=UPI002954FDC5|nr:hypothetical protein [Azotobacter beijerinckii]MDV7212827.1 hypothetical protein [Azotobacter beijerinckii]